MIHKSSIDNNTYNFKNLPNGLKMLLVTNPKLDKSSCSMSIRTGSNDDTIPGIAHFLEHMLFMGTEKYKSENDFMEFLNMHNGSTNAHTCEKITTYYFDISSGYLLDALDRFCEFFVSPLFIADAVERELNAVDSEFKNGLLKDTYRLWRLLNVMCNDEYNKFSCGNRETLNVENIREKVVQFWKDNYSSDEMCLTIYHNEDIEKNAQTMFSRIKQISKKDKIDPMEFIEFKKHIFKQGNLNRLIHVNPISDTRQLKIYIEVPKERFMFKDNTYGYLSFLLSKESKGSLSNILSSQNYTFDINFDVYSDIQYSLLVLSFGLTELGFKECKKVINIIKTYLMSVNGKEEEYNNLKKAKNRTFRYMEQDNPIDFVVDLSENMHYYPAEYILNHDLIYEKYNEDEMQKIISIIQESTNWLIFVLGKNNQLDFDLKEQHYGIEYKIESEELGNINETRTHNVENGKLQFLFQNKYKVPESYVTIRLNADITPENYLAHAMYIGMCANKYEELYDDFMTFNGLCFQSKIFAKGFEIIFSGFNENLIEAINLFFALFWRGNFDTFEKAREGLEQRFYKELNDSPYRLILCELPKIIYENVPNISNLLNQIGKIQIEDVNIKHSYFVDMFVCGSGNFYAYQNLLDEISAKIGTYKNDRSVQMFDNQTVNFETQDNLNNACGIFLYNGKKKDVSSVANTDLILQIGNELFFDQLRTKEAFGYVVCNRRTTVSDDTYSFYIVQSERDNKVIEARINQFIVDLQKLIINMDDEEFETHKESVISGYEETFKNLNEYYLFYNELYFTGAFDLDYQKNVIEALKRVNKGDVVLPVCKSVIFADKKRKLN